MRLLVKSIELKGKKDIWSHIKFIVFSVCIWLNDTTYRYIWGPIKRFINSIITLFIWLPVMWKDAQWDYSYLYVILRKKLTLMQKAFSSPKAMSISSDEKATEIKECIKILDRLIENDYNKEGYEAYYNKWGKPVFETEEIEGEKGFVKLNITHPNVKTEQDSRQQSLEVIWAARKEVEERTEDVENLFTNLQNKIEDWWD